MSSSYYSCVYIYIYGHEAQKGKVIYRRSQSLEAIGQANDSVKYSLIYNAESCSACEWVRDSGSPYQHESHLVGKGGGGAQGRMPANYGSISPDHSTTEQLEPKRLTKGAQGILFRIGSRQPT